MINEFDQLNSLVESLVCDPNSYRSFSAKPFYYPGYYYATNGHVLVRYSSAVLPDDLAPSKEAISLATHRLWREVDNHRKSTSLGLLEFKDRIPCDECGGNGIVEECPQCKKEPDDDYVDTCESCQVCRHDSPNNRAIDGFLRCRRCNGVGFNLPTDDNGFYGGQNRVELDNAGFAHHYLTLISALALNSSIHYIVTHSRSGLSGCHLLLFYA